MLRARTLCPRSLVARSARASRTPLESLERRTLFAAGDPDPAFGFGGYAAADFGDGTAYAGDLAANAQRIVVVGNLWQDGTPGNLAIAAFRHDGTVDTSFSGDGKLLTGIRAHAGRVAIRADGKILVSGNVPDEDGRTVEAVVLRFNADGTPDATFGGGDGRATSPVAGYISLAPGNKVVIGGRRYGDEFPSGVFSVARLNPDGSPDTSFGGDGVVDHRFDTGGEPGHWTGTNAVAVQGDGKVILAGTVYGSSQDDYWDGAVARLNADGSTDTTFGGGDGRVVLSFGYVDDFATAVTVAPDGSILVGAVEGEYHAMPMRLSADGTAGDRFSPVFDRSHDSRIRDLHVDSEGNVVATGEGDLSAPDGGTPYNYFLGRYRGDGDGLVAGFGGYAGGRFAYVPGEHSALAPDDGILVAQDVGNDGAFKVHKYLVEGGEDASGSATMAGGTLAIAGTSRGDEIRVEPGGAAGRVVLRVNGYERSFTGVSAISLSAGEGDDDVRVAEAVTLPTTLSGGAGEDRLEGGGGADRIEGGDAYDVLRGFAGDDVILSGAGGGALLGGAGDDRLLGGPDADAFYAEPGADHVSGGGGRDRIDYGGRTADLRITLDGVADDGEAGERDNVMPDVEDVWGGDGDDLIVGSDADNELKGGARGDDTVRGLGGDDQLWGTYYLTSQIGNDLLEGGDGDDILRSAGGNPDAFRATLLGGNGNDELFVEPDDTHDGGPGVDSVNGVREDGVPTWPASHIYLDQATDTLYVHTRDGGNDSVQLSRVTGPLARFPETLVAIIRHADGTTRRVDVPYGDVRKIDINTDWGDDLVEMGLVTIPARIDLGAGNDTVLAGMGNDTVFGNAGNDSINGNAGDDSIDDTEGANTITGGLGTDTINGVRETPTGDAIYQAEDATVFGARVRNGNRGYTGSGYVDFDHTRGDFVRWNVTANRGGTHALTFRYAHGGPSDRPLQLTVNGQVVASRLSFPPTGSWTTWRTVTAEVPLDAGNNQVALTAVGFGGPNVDSLSFRATEEPPPAGDSWTIQGEDALIADDRDATVRSTHPGYTGRGYLDFSRDLGATVQWDFDEVPGPGEYEVEFRYANGGAGPRTLNFHAGDGPARPLTFAPTGSWSTWGTVSVRQTLGEGNMLSVSLDTVGGDGPNIDSVTVRRVSAPQALELQAEQARMSGARVKSSNGGFTGTGYADYDNPAGDWVEWAFEQPAAGRRTLTFRYANGSLSDRALELRVNGQVVAPRLSFAPTGSWTTWREVSVMVDLAAGANRVRLTSVGSNGPNVDLLAVR